MLTAVRKNVKVGGGSRKSLVGLERNVRMKLLLFQIFVSLWFIVLKKCATVVMWVL